VPIGEQIDRAAELVRVETLERAAHVVEVARERPGDDVDRRTFSDPFRRGPQRVDDLRLGRRLQVGETLEAELGGKPQHRGAARVRPGRQLGDRAERHDLEVVEHDFGDAPFGGGQP
jgi:hypothetical protein